MATMEVAKDPNPTSTDDNFLAAHQIFEGYGVESTSSMRANDLMHQCDSFLNENKADRSLFRRILDPDRTNPEINVTKLANTLYQYSRIRKSNKALNESSNLKKEQGSREAASEISAGGLQLIEDLRNKLKEKECLASQLKSQLASNDRRNEDVIASLMAERDILKCRIHRLSVENSKLSHFSQDHEELSERLSCSSAALDETRYELQSARRRARATKERLEVLEAENQSLKDLLSKSKYECHRFKTMYADRQSVVEDYEMLKDQHAILSNRLQHQDSLLKEALTEKMCLEFELKDILNKSNMMKPRLDSVLSESYTEDMPKFDRLNADSRFSIGDVILDDHESFEKALTKDQGRCTNMSFDESRLSFDVSHSTEIDKTNCEKIDLNNSEVVKGMQIDFGHNSKSDQNKSITSAEAQLDLDVIRGFDSFLGTQNEPSAKSNRGDKTNAETKSENDEISVSKAFECNKAPFGKTQTDALENVSENNIKSLTEDKEVACQSVGKFVPNPLHFIKKVQKLIALKNKQQNSQEAETQTVIDRASVSTQTELNNPKCVGQDAVAPRPGPSTSFWKTVIYLFILFAVICLINLVYGAVRRVAARQQHCPRTNPWRWLSAQDIMELLFNESYSRQVPM